MYSFGRSTIQTRELIEPGRRVSIELSVCAPTHFTKHIFGYIFPQERLDVPASVSSFKNKLMVGSDGTSSSQFSQEELKHVVLASVNKFAYFGEVSENHLLGS